MKIEENFVTKKNELKLKTCSVTCTKRFEKLNVNFFFDLVNFFFKFFRIFF